MSNKIFYPGLTGYSSQYLLQMADDLRELGEALHNTALTPRDHTLADRCKFIARMFERHLNQRTEQ